MDLNSKINNDLKRLIIKHGKECTVDGNAEECMIPWRDRQDSMTDFVYNAIFNKNSSVINGSLVVVDERSYLVTFFERTVAGDKFCAMVKCNSDIIVQRYGQPEDVNGDPVGDPEFITIATNIIAYAQYVNADLRQQDIGLLATTEYILIVQKSVDVKKPNDPSLFQADHVVLNGRNYQVDVVDDVKMPNLYHVQLSVYIR